MEGTKALPKYTSSLGKTLNTRGFDPEKCEFYKLVFTLIAFLFYGAVLCC